MFIRVVGHDQQDNQNNRDGNNHLLLQICYIGTCFLGNFKKNKNRNIQKRFIEKAHYSLAAFLLLIGAFYGCQKENNDPQPQNNPPVASVYASQKEGKAPLDSRIKVDGTDKDGKSDIARYSLEIKKLGIDFNKKNPIDTTISFSEAGEYTVSLDLILVTNNMREFKRIPDLQLENWIE